MIRDIGVAESALGDWRKRPQPSKLEISAVAHSSIVAARDLPADTRAEDRRTMRPGTEIAPARAETAPPPPLQRRRLSNHRGDQ
jgi:hypothetical protein